MTKYAVLYTAVASTIVEVEADDEASARSIADDQVEFPSLCAQCSGWNADRSRNSGIEVGEWDQDEGEYGVREADS